MKIKIKYFTDIEPIDFTGGMETSNWIDLRCAEDVHMKPRQFELIPLGVAMELPEGYEAIVAPRSSTFKKWGIIMTNSIGVIDTSYCGDDDQWRFPAYALFEADIKKGDRIAQFRIQKRQPAIEFETVEHLTAKNRGGIGSTGTR